MSPSTDPETAGLSTSEGKLTLLAFAVGTVLELAVIPALQALKDTYPQSAWVVFGVGLAGALLQVVSVLGYQRARTQLKLGLLSKDAGFPVNHPPAPPADPES